jgi:hypothetical protein
MEWDHQRSEEYTVNDYEGNRTPAKNVKIIKGQDRLNLLTFEWRASLDDILDANKETRIIRQQRDETRMQNRIQQGVEEFVEYAEGSFPKFFMKINKRKNKRKATPPK